MRALLGLVGLASMSAIVGCSSNGASAAGDNGGTAGIRGDGGTSAHGGSAGVAGASGGFGGNTTGKGGGGNGVGGNEGKGGKSGQGGSGGGGGSLGGSAGAATAGVGGGSGAAAGGGGTSSGGGGGQSAGGGGVNGGGSAGAGGGAGIPAPLACTRMVGTGSGSVDIQQAALGLVDGDVVCIAAGAYSSFHLAKIKADPAHPITIQNDGVVTFSGSSAGEDLTGVVLSGAGKGASDTANGFRFANIGYRAITLSGTLHDVTLQYLDFENIGDYTIYVPGAGLVYDGTDATALTDLKVLHSRGKAFGDGFLTLSGTTKGPDLVGIARRVEVAYCELSDTPKASYAFWLGTGFDAHVHHNRVTGFALQLAQHNGVVFFNGDGVVDHNYFRNYLGEGLRLWPFSWGQAGKIDVFANIFLESQKYSAVEIQAFDADVNRNANTRHTDVRIFNNTAGHLNMETMLPNNYEPWVAGIVDTYGFSGGKVDVANNLAFDINMQKAGNPFLNVQGNGVATLTTNLYFDTWAKAGLLDDTALHLSPTSPAVSAGTPVTGLGTDYYGAAYGNPPDIGAVRH